MILKKAIGADQVDESKILLNNNVAIRAKDSGGSAQSILKFNASNLPEFLYELVVVDPTNAAHAASKGYVDTAIAGIVTTGAMTYKGAFDASGGSYPVSPVQGDEYRVSVQGTVSAVVHFVGDTIVYNGASWDLFRTAGNSDEIAEGSTNLYFTNTRAKTAAVLNTLGGSQTDQAPSVAAVNAALALKDNVLTGAKEDFVLNATNITNQYVDLAQVVRAKSVHLRAYGAEWEEGVDYSVSLTGGSGGKTRVSLIPAASGGQLATGGTAALVSGDDLRVDYLY